MNSKLIYLQQRISHLLLDKIETQEMSLDRASQIARKVIFLLPDSINEQQMNQVLPEIETIPELHGITGLTS